MTTTREFVLEHENRLFDVTIWNECKSSPTVCYDFNNVLNTYEMSELAEAAKFYNSSYAIVSLLHGKGQNFQDLYNRAEQTGECIVAITLKSREDRNEKMVWEKSLKWAVIKKLHWDKVEYALDDKPHEWYSPDEPDLQNQQAVKAKRITRLPLDVTKSVYKISVRLY